MTHEQLKAQAIDSIKKLHGDTSVSQQQTLESLEEVMDELGMCMDALKEDIRNQETK